MVGNKGVVACVVLGGLVAAAGAASAGVPAWCKGAKSDQGDLSRLQTKDPGDVIAAYVQVECVPTPEIQAHRAEIEAGRAAWSKKLGMTEDDWADAVAWSTKDADSLKADLSTKKLTDMTPIDQWQVMFEADDAGQGVFDSLYLADVFGDKLSEVAKIQLIAYCLKEHSEGGNEEIWAACAQDIASFNSQKLFDELRADTKHKGDIKQKLRIAASAIPAELKKHADEVKELMATDPAWKKIFDLADKSRGEWPAIATKNADTLAIDADLESAVLAQSKSMFEGCDAKTYAALGKSVADLKADAFTKLGDERMNPFGGFASKALPLAVKTPSVYLAAIGVALCSQRQGLSEVLGEALDEVPTMRGPRNYALGKLKFSGIELDKVGSHISHARPRHPYSGRAAGGNMHSAGFPIKAIKKKGTKLTLEAMPLMVKREVCTKEHNTGRIDRFVNGQAMYVIQCDVSHSEMVDDSWGSMDVDAKYESVLKVGMIVSASKEDVIALYPNKTATKPNWMLGGPVK